MESTKFISTWFVSSNEENMITVVLLKSYQILMIEICSRHVLLRFPVIIARCVVFPGHIFYLDNVSWLPHPHHHRWNHRFLLVNSLRDMYVLSCWGCVCVDMLTWISCSRCRPDVVRCVPYREIDPVHFDTDSVRIRTVDNATPSAWHVVSDIWYHLMLIWYRFNEELPLLFFPLLQDHISKI